MSTRPLLNLHGPAVQYDNNFLYIDGRPVGLPPLNKGADYWFVDSNVDGSAGSTPDFAFGTLDEAINVASEYDIIVAMAGHTESLTADSAVDMDVAGVAVIGLGKGSNRPTFNFNGTDADADFKMAAADCSISNLLFICSDVGNDQAMAIEMTATDCEVSNCELRNLDAGTAEPLNFITIGVSDGDCDRCYVHHNKIHVTGAGGETNSGIDVVGDHTGLRIEDNNIYGDFDEAGIMFQTTANASLDASVLRNIVTNNQTGIRAIDLQASGSTGMCADNLIRTNAPATAIQTGGMAALNNIWSDGTASSFDLSSGGGGGLVCVKSVLNIGAAEVSAFTVAGGPILVTGLIFDVTETAAEGATFVFDDFVIEGGGTSLFHDTTQELNIDDTFSVGDMITCLPTGAARVAKGADIDAHGFSRVFEAGTLTVDGANTTDFEVNAYLFYHSLGGNVVAIP